MVSSTAGKFDVAIVGAGPAGSATAIRLARGGLKVVLIERASFPREKLCGEFVSPECLRHFRDLGAHELEADRYPSIASTIFYSQGGRSVEFDSVWFGAGLNALGISRAEMDECLLEHAHRAGASVFTETAFLGASVLPGGPACVRLRRKDGTVEQIEADIVVDATGRKRALGLQQQPTTRATRVAFKTHLSGATISRSRCEIYSYGGGYGGCNAVGANLFNLCFIVDADLVKAVGSDPAAVMRSILFRNRFAKAALDGAAFDHEWLAVPVAGFGRRPPVELERLFFIGDAAAFIDPFTGSGILLALQSAEICAESIRGGFEAGKSPEGIGADYAKRYKRLLGKRLFVSSLLRPAANSPRLAEIVLAVVSRSDRLRAALARATRVSGVPDV